MVEVKGVVAIYICLSLEKIIPGLEVLILHIANPVHAVLEDAH